MNELITSPSETETRLSVRAEELLAAASRALIDSDDASERGADLAKLIRVAHKRLEEERTALTGPLNQVIKAINDRFRVYTDLLKDAKLVLDNKMLAYAAKVAAEKGKAAEQARREMGVELQPAVPAKAPAARGNLGSVASVVTKTKIRVVDFAKLPDEWKVPDMVRLQKATDAGVRAIPGTELYEDSHLAVR